MKRQSVTSSAIRSVGYNGKARVLELEFEKGGVYQYYEVPEAEYDSLMNADSLGKYFLDHIKDVYATEKV